MSIQSEVNRITSNIASAYTALAEKGAEMPEQQNSENLATAILSVPIGVELPELTNPGTAENLLEGTQMIDGDGNVVEGTMTQWEFQDTRLGDFRESYTVPEGYHDGNGKVYICLEEKSVTPTKSAQDITATDGMVLSKVIVEPIPDEYQDVSAVTATAEDVAAGKVFVDTEGNVVTGTAETGGGSAGTVTCTITAVGPLGPTGTLHYVDGDGNYQTTTAKGSISVMKNTLVVAVSGGDGVQFSGDAASNNIGASAEIKVAYVTGDFTLKM